MKKILLISIVIFSFLPAFSQYEIQVDQFWLDFSRLNPGSVGSKDMVCVSGIISDNQMFNGFSGGPRTTLFNANAPFNLFGAKHGVGLSFVNDQIGFFNDIKFSLAYAYRHPMGEGHLGIGLSGEFHQTSINPKWVGTEDYNPLIDPMVPQGKQDGVLGINLSFGIFYRAEDIFFGLGAKNLLTAKEIQYETSSTTSGQGGTNAYLPLKTHYTATAGYTLQLNNPSFEYTPSLLVRSESNQITIDFNNVITYNKQIWGGVTYRHGAAVVGMFGLTIYEDIRISFAYEAKTNAMATYGGNTIEMALNYCFKMGVEKSPQKYRSIRYL